MQDSEPMPKPVGCPEDAKVCPDGTALSRVPPDCEFPGCPTTELCDYNADPDKNYVGKSQEECSRIRFMCVEGTEAFFDACGCEKIIA